MARASFAFRSGTTHDRPGIAVTGMDPAIAQGVDGGFDTKNDVRFFRMAD
jgi:hypothetical protein